MTDATLSRVSPRSWQGTLHGYRVLVSDIGGWSATVMHPEPQVFTMVVLRAESLQAAAARAREWIETTIARLPADALIHRLADTP